MVEEKKLTSRRAQAIQTKNKILKTAYDMMQEKGFENVTIEEISEKSGVSVGAFYYYFKSKNEILNIIFLKADEYVKKNVESKHANENAVNSIICFFHYHAKYTSSNGVDFTKLLYHNENKAFIDQDRELFKILFAAIEKGQETGELITTITAERMTNYFLIAARGLVFDWCLHDGSYDLVDAMKDYMEHLAPTFKHD